MTSIVRALIATGILPERVGPAGELRRLQAARDAALRTWQRYHDHSSEISYNLADEALRRFGRQHPE